MPDASWLLRTEPTVDLWSLEIRAILNGAREEQICFFGSAPGYIKTLLVNSVDYALAEHCLDAALRRVVEVWRPLASPDYGRDLRMLQLLGRFPVSEGIGRVLSFLKGLDGYGISSSPTERTRIKSASLQVMESYFPVEQPPAGAFAEYLAQLEQNFSDRSYLIYAVSRLHQLRKLNVGDSRVGDSISLAPEVVPDLLGVFLPGLSSDKRGQRSVVRIYQHCLRNSDVSMAALLGFEAALKSSGLVLVRGRHGPILEDSRGRWRLEIRLDEGDLKIYYARVHLHVHQSMVNIKFEESQSASLREVPAVQYRLMTPLGKEG